MARDCEFVKDDVAKGKMRIDSATGGSQWDLVPKEPGQLSAKDRVEQHGKVHTLYTGLEEDFDRSMWEMQNAPAETSSFMMGQSSDESRMWMERCRQAEQQNAQWQKVVQQQQLQARTSEPVVQQLLHAVPTTSQVVTAPVSNEPGLTELLKTLVVKLAKMTSQLESGF